jgi:hypothetical protein
VSISSVVGYDFQRPACTPHQRWNNPLIEHILYLRGLIPDERFYLTVIEVNAHSWNTN